MNQFVTPEFWFHHRRFIRRRELDYEVRISVCLPITQEGQAFWSARVGLIRALARDRPEGLVWFWIGPHDRYEELMCSDRHRTSTTGPTSAVDLKPRTLSLFVGGGGFAGQGRFPVSA